MSETVIVTGAGGFVGHHVAEALSTQGHNVIGVTLHADISPDTKRFLAEHIVCDLSDEQAVSKLPFKNAGAFINLAGIALNPLKLSDEEAERLVDTNLSVHTVPYERIERLGLPIRIIAISSGAVFDPKQPMPLNEDSRRFTADNAPTAYIKSKALVEAAVAKFKADGLDILTANPFNHFGPGQRGGFLVPDWAERLMSGGITEEQINWLNTFRDFTDVGDVSNAYVLMATLDRSRLAHDSYVIASGESTRSYDLVAMLARRLGKTLPQMTAPDNPAKIYGDPGRFIKDTGWRRKIMLPQTIADYADWFLSQR